LLWSRQDTPRLMSVMDVLRTVRNSQVVETPGAGHGEGMGDECTRGIVRDFIANPRAKAETNCLSAMALRFVTDVKTIGYLVTAP
jgi:hypothetical protein